MHLTEFSLLAWNAYLWEKGISLLIKQQMDSSKNYWELDFLKSVVGGRFLMFWVD